MPQMCPNCGQDNRDAARFCAHCQTPLQGLLGSHTRLQNRYETIRLLGCGGMGAVYLALDHRLGQNQVAVKENFDTSSQAQAQFQREANVLAKLSHPNLPKVIDHFIEPTGRQYLVMEYVGGYDLHTLMQQRGALPEAQVLAWADALLDALAYLHGRPQPIIHRDIKPANIKVTPDGKVKLVDFGLVKFFDPASPRTSASMRGLGTPEYAPPEPYNAAGFTDRRSDIYSLGATLYHLLTGQAPATATLRMANPAILRPPRQILSAIGPSTEAAILRAMELPMNLRFQSAAEMRRALRRVAPVTAAMPSAPRPAMPVSPPPVQPTPVVSPHMRPAPARNRPPLWMGFAATVLVVACAVAALMSRNLLLAPAMLAPSTPYVTVVAAGATAAPTGRPDIALTPVAAVIVSPTRPIITEPTKTPEKPLPTQAVRDYYQAINNRQYDVTWAMLSTRFKDKFNCCLSNGQYDFGAYVAWWDSVARVDVGEVRLVRQTDSHATVYAQTSYLMKSGDRIADDKPYVQLEFDPATYGWLFDDKGVNP